MRTCKHRNYSPRLVTCLTALAAAVLAAGCPSNGDDNPDAGGDVSLADVQGLFAQRCAGSTCHVDFTTAAPGANMDLRAAALCSSVIGVPSEEVPDMPRVVRGDASASYLPCKLDPDCARLPDRAEFMPPGAALAASERDLVVRWINADAPGCPTPEEDVTAPIFAGAKSATPLAQAARIEWDAAADDVTAAADIVYLVYQASASGDQDFTTPALETAPGATSATVTGLDVATEYFFVARARDAAGNVDTNTAEVQATTLDVNDTTAPTFAGAATGTAIGTSAVQLTWLAASDDVSPADDIVYNVYMAETSGEQDLDTPTLTTPAGATGALVTDRGLRAGVQYFFVVRAEDRAGNEDTNTEEIAVTTEDAIIFAEDIEPIFFNNCASADCHDSDEPEEGMDLTQGNVHASLVNTSAIQCMDEERQRVAPDSPDDSYVVDKLTGVDLCFGDQMPKVGNPLSDAEIELIRQWIAAGAPNN